MYPVRPAIGPPAGQDAGRSYWYVFNK